MVCRYPVEPAFRDQRPAGLFGHRNEALLARLQVDVAEVDVVELHATDFLELLLHPATALERVLQAAAHDLLVVLAVRADQLEQAGDGSAHGDGVALVEVVAELEPLVDRVGEVALAHLAQVLGQIVDDQAVLVGEELRAHLRDLPARHIGMEPVEEGRVDHGLGKRGEQMAGLHQGFDGLVDVAHEDHRGIGVDRSLPRLKEPDAM